MKKILITGVGGFIGTNLIIKLIEKNYEVTVIDDLLEQIHGSNPLINSTLYNSVKDKIGFIYDTILNPESIEKAITDISKIKSLFGYIPKISFETGIDKFTKCVLSQEVEQDLYEKSLMELKSKGLLK